MEHFNVGDYLGGYQILMEYADSEKSLCIGKKGDEYAIFTTEDNFTVNAHTMLTKEEAKYLLLKNLKSDNMEELYNNAKNEIALYVFGTKDINNKQTKILQCLFNTEKILENYIENCKNWTLAIEKYIYENMNTNKCDKCHID